MIDEDDYLKHKTVCKSCYNKNRRKNTLVEKQIETTINNQRSIMSTIKLMFQNLKIELMLLLVQET